MSPKTRWNDFQKRVQYAPGSVYQHRSHHWQYIPVHPFGDEPDILTQLKIKPEDCHSADAWWGIDNDATLLETTITRISKTPPQLFAKATPKKWVYLVAVFDAPYVTRSLVESAMLTFANAGFPKDPRFRLQWGDPHLVIS